VTIKRFEDIRAWQEARVLTKQIYALCKKSLGLRGDRRSRDQLQTATVSVMSNIAEGFSRRTDWEFTQFPFVAKGSTAEVQSLLYVAVDQEYLGEQDFAGLYRKADEVARIISGFITSLLTRSARNRSKNHAQATRGIRTLRLVCVNSSIDPMP
jgi:four helix bundle protein